ncbi:MAG: homoserine kinase [Saprospiraceae bacterium]|nr:homoserine kinase [Saprospiraceae bacterium]
MTNPGIKAFAPASVANVACGFDILGFALKNPGDFVVARHADHSDGLRITKITGDQGKLPRDVRKNTATVAVQALLDHLGESSTSIDLEIQKKMPFGSGLGSSAASAVAAVVAVNKLLGAPYTKSELLPFAVLGEQSADGAYHADNVAPALLGGLILIQDTASLRWVRVPLPKGLVALVVHPKIEVLTRSAREIIQPTVSLELHSKQAANLGGLILGMMQSDFELIGASLQDLIIEPQRMKLIPHFGEVKTAAIQEGALGCSISGAGPSIFALFNNTLLAENAAAKMSTIFHQKGIEATAYLSTINQEGAYIC